VSTITAASLGDAEFREDYGIKYAYLAGAMYKGIASKELVVALAKVGLMGFLGTGGMSLEQIETSIRHIQQQLRDGEAYGMNLLCDLHQPQVEERTVDLYIRYGIRNVEAAAFTRITAALARLRLTGIKRTSSGALECPRRIIAKVSRPEVASAFMEPAPEQLVGDLVASGRLAPAEAELARQLPMADDICVEADSGGHTDRGVAYALMPAMRALRARMMERHRFAKRIRVGAAGGIGTPEAAAAALIMGAEFILTGSINQCTAEAGTSSAVKELLAGIDVQDTAYAPAGDMFELGAKVQVVRKGLFFPARANKLYELYQRYDCLEQIDARTREQIEKKYFGRSFEDVWQETLAYYRRTAAERTLEVELTGKQKMAAVFKWYFAHSTRLALQGDEQHRVDFQVHCGPALGAFNQWVRGTELERWQNRRVADIGARIMHGAAECLTERLAAFSASGANQTYRGPYEQPSMAGQLSTAGVVE
jgi:trans-AT polyketide synthase/acyltransferase/oxidoreductase domain-containing protein